MSGQESGQAAAPTSLQYIHWELIRSTSAQSTSSSSESGGVKPLGSCTRLCRRPGALPPIRQRLDAARSGHLSSFPTAQLTRCTAREHTKHLAQIHRDLADVFSFRQIHAGADHHQEIATSSERASYAILLVSKDFLSDYVADEVYTQVAKHLRKAPLAHPSRDQPEPI